MGAAPVEGQANKELIESFAGQFRLPRRSVTIVQGEKSRNKVIRLDLEWGEQVLRELGLIT